MEKLKLTEMDQLYLKMLVVAMQHFRDSRLYVTCNSIYFEECHIPGYKGVEVLMSGSDAHDFMRSLGVDPESVKPDKDGWQEFVVDDVAFRVEQEEEEK